MSHDYRVAVVGLGYVGWPLARAFSRKFKTLGFDISATRLESLKGDTHQVELSSEPSDLKSADFVIIAVPTPIDQARRPDLNLLLSACQTAGSNLKKNAIVIIESTVYPGLTEEICVPVLEGASQMKCGKDFEVGYSPERINPGDEEHSLESVTKVVSAQNETTLERISSLYGAIISAGTFKASSIRVAEAAKVIENTQRDLNIALMNELAIIFDRMDIDTQDVLQTASTKWNFIPFRPGLVGGHCIGVDPYYLTHKAEMLDYNPQVILAGRRINDSMGKFVAEKTVKQLISSDQRVKDAEILVLGVTFKENCDDVRNSRVFDTIQELQSYGARVRAWDPVADWSAVPNAKEIRVERLEDLQKIDAIVAAVGHEEIKQVDLEFLRKKANGPIPWMDVKAQFDRKALKEHGFRVWRL